MLRQFLAFVLVPLAVAILFNGAFKLFSTYLSGILPW